MVKSKIRRRNTIPKSIRLDLWSMWFGLDTGRIKCPVCKDRYILQMDHDVGHIKPRSKGGKDRVDNLMPICRLCNSSMGTMNLIRYTRKWYNRPIRYINRIRKGIMF